MLHLYNTLTRQKDPFIPKKEGEVSIYSCGPTVYNTVHIGNIRAFLFADTLQRWLKFGEKLDTKWVMNITDVDDKTIRDSKEKYPDLDPNEALKKFTVHYADIFFEDLKTVNVDMCHFLKNPYATDYIAEMQVLIQTIVDNGYGYVSDGSVYLDVQKYRNDYKYGELVKLNFDDMVSTQRVEDDEYEKESVSDFVLWKGKKEGEPFWEFELRSPLSTGDGEGFDEAAHGFRTPPAPLVRGEIVSLPGRPGWHIECSAMSKSLFPDFPFDIHTGGVDLCFPHHEDEICQARAGYGSDTARFWCHNEHLMVEGKKMSKSRGNFYTLRDLEEKGIDAEVVRFFLVTNQYRKKVNLSEESLRASAKMLSRMKGFVKEITNEELQMKNPRLNSLPEGVGGLIEGDAFLAEFREAMRDDLNVSVAIAKAFGFLKKMAGTRLSEDGRQQVLTCVELVEDVFGVSFSGEEKSTDIPDTVLDLVRQRDEARAEKNWAESDALRDRLQGMGYRVVDGAGRAEVEVMS